MFSADLILQIVADKGSDGHETMCIFLKEILLGQTISRQLYSQRREENIQKYKKSKTYSAFCLKKAYVDLKQLNSVVRTCPFSRITFEAKHDVLYTRKCFYKFEPAVYNASEVIQNNTILREFFSEVEKAVNSDCTGISQEEALDIKDVLPDLIHLGRSEWYSFVFYLYLENEFQVGELWSGQNKEVKGNKRQLRYASLKWTGKDVFPVVYHMNIFLFRSCFFSTLSAFLLPSLSSWHRD